ncbi:MAG: hypothetical protein J1F69_00950 [Clostridiales bacterium]|nr:hypothetical protein [Clostridiales bacterium]
MKTSGTTDAVLPLSKKQKCACNIVMGCLLVATGIILVLAGAGVIKAAVRDIAAPTVLLGFGAAVLLSAVIAKNSLSMWFAGVVLSCGAVSLFAVTTAAGYAELYPIYVASPAIGCVFSVWFAENKLSQIKAMVFFGVIGGILMLGSFGACRYGLVAGLLAAFGGLTVIAIALETYFKKDNVDNA